MTSQRIIYEDLNLAGAFFENFKVFPSKSEKVSPLSPKKNYLKKFKQIALNNRKTMVSNFKN